MLNRRPTTTSSRAVIWLSVSVPVLSEQIADVEPSVSTDLRRLMIAPFAANSLRADRQQHRDDRRQAGRDGRDREGDADREDRVEVVAADEAHDHDKHQRRRRPSS